MCVDFSLFGVVQRALAGQLGDEWPDRVQGARQGARRPPPTRRDVAPPHPDGHDCQIYESHDIVNNTPFEINILKNCENIDFAALIR